jgi:hypothetical protein
LSGPTRGFGNSWDFGPAEDNRRAKTLFDLAYRLRLRFS